MINPLTDKFVFISMIVRVEEYLKFFDNFLNVQSTKGLSNLIFDRGQRLRGVFFFVVVLSKLSIELDQKSRQNVESVFLLLLYW